jgi:PucR-like helix-turn-helix protein/diguanylate cyclase with GGDEF domain
VGAVLTQARTALTDRLRARRGEIEQATLARVFAICDPSDADPVYLEGLRAAVSIAIDYALEAIERGEASAPPPPPALMAQARMAARSGISLDVVLRRYLAGYALLSDTLVAELEEEPAQGVALRRVLREQGAVFDRLLAAIGEEYSREAANRAVSTEARRVERVERLLAGEQLDSSGLAYDFECHHTALIAAGSGAAEAIRDLAAALDRRLLLVRRGEEATWAWLGFRHGPEPGEIERAVATEWPKGPMLAIGEPGRGMAGWRLTHRQAAAALPIALRERKALVRYRDVALLASVLKDDLLSASLHQLYLDRLGPGNEGDVNRRTLHAYFTADRNVSSTAAALGVSRRTVTIRLKTVEERLGRPLRPVAADVETALRLHDLRSVPSTFEQTDNSTGP